MTTALRRRYGHAGPKVRVLWRPNEFDKGAHAIVGDYFMTVHPAGDNRWWWKVEGGTDIVAGNDRELSLKAAQGAAELAVALARLKARRAA